MQQELHTTNAERSQRPTTDHDSAHREDGRDDAAQDMNEASAPQRNYRQAWKEEYAPW